MLADPNALDRAFHALSDPTRRAVVSRLAEGELPITVLAEPFSMALPSFTQHIQVLESCGLISTEKRGRSRWCRLRADNFLEAADWMVRELHRWERRLDRLEAYLDKEKERHERLEQES